MKETNIFFYLIYNSIFEFTASFLKFSTFYTLPTKVCLGYIGHFL